MSEGRNVFAVARSIWDDGDFADEPFTEREAWIWLVSASAWKDRRTRGNTKRGVDIKRGEFSFAVRFLAEKWQWSSSKVDRFIQRLEKRDMLRDVSRDGSQIYSIKNYNYFQVVGLPKRDSARDAERDSSGTAAGQRRDKEETGKQVNRETKVVRAADAATGGTPPATDACVDLFQQEETFDPEDCFEQARRAYNDAAHIAARSGACWSICNSLSETRKKKPRQRLAECSGIDGWRAAMLRAAESPHLNGTAPRSAGFENWWPDFDFFLQAKSFTKLLEGSYDAKHGAAPTGGGGYLAAAARVAARRASAGGD
jgi:hypothetical protein